MPRQEIYVDLEHVQLATNYRTKLTSIVAKEKNKLIFRGVSFDRQEPKLIAGQFSAGKRFFRSLSLASGDDFLAYAMVVSEGNKIMTIFLSEEINITFPGLHQIIPNQRSSKASFLVLYSIKDRDYVSLLTNETFSQPPLFFTFQEKTYFFLPSLEEKKIGVFLLEEEKELVVEIKLSDESQEGNKKSLPRLLAQFEDRVIFGYLNLIYSFDGRHLREMKLALLTGNGKEIVDTSSNYILVKKEKTSFFLYRFIKEEKLRLVPINHWTVEEDLISPQLIDLGMIYYLPSRGRLVILN